MTPKENAKELIESFYKCMPFRDVKLTSCDETPELIIQMEKLSAKQCALIAVDEMIKQQQIQFDEMVWSCVGYWQEVKQELEKI
jgi:hypothetical protein